MVVDQARWSLLSELLLFLSLSAIPSTELSVSRQGRNVG